MNTLSEWPYTIHDAASAEIIRWQGTKVGVDYTYRNGDREAHGVGAEDWPVIRKLKRAGKLSYQSDEVRAGMRKSSGLASTAYWPRPLKGRAEIALIVMAITSRVAAHGHT
jgi:hypothetical protein